MTKTFTIITISVAILISGSAFAGWEKIKTEAEFNTLIVDKHVTYKACDIVFEKNGEMSGKCGKNNVKGVWQFKNGLVCRQATIGNKQYNPDCQLYEVDGNNVKITRNRGKGEQFVWKIR